MKTAERAHMPNRWWERVRLPSNYNTALKMIDERLVYWPKFLVHKCKQRLTRLTQVAIRTKRLQKEAERLGERLVPKLAPKVRQREATRERKAEAAAKVERAIERELIERLRSGAYGDRPLNVEEGVWKRVLRGLERSGEGVHDEDLDEGLEEANEEAYEQEIEYERETAAGNVEYVSDDGHDSESGEEDLGDLENWLGGQSAGEDSEADEMSANSDSDDQDNDSGEDDARKLKKAIHALKRKRPAVSHSESRKKAQKGPKRQIEYEMERAEPDLPQLLSA
jgi:protein MAK16